MKQLLNHVLLLSFPLVRPRKHFTDWLCVVGLLILHDRHNLRIIVEQYLAAASTRGKKTPPIIANSSYCDNIFLTARDSVSYCYNLAARSSSKVRHVNSSNQFALFRHNSGRYGVISAITQLIECISCCFNKFFFHKFTIANTRGGRA